MKNKMVGIIGLGYVGLPLVIGFAKSGLRVVGFDVKQERVDELNKGKDSTKEVTSEELNNAKSNITYTTSEATLKECDYLIITVPTPTKKNKKPDLSFIESASKTVGRNLRTGSIVVLESTVWPGVTEEIMAPILEKESGMKCGKDFKVGYSPERINPGDKEHTLSKVTKVVSAVDEESTSELAELYSKITTVHTTPNIRTAEMAKVIENTQRDLNIALMNEIALISEKLGISVWDVLEASYTKWNFGKYKPGLVGGHCIPEDPYFLVHRAEELGYHPQVILAGRNLNDFMPKFFAQTTLRKMTELNNNSNKKILILGVTFKENVPDLRTSPAKLIIDELISFGAEVIAYDPVVGKSQVEKMFGIKSINSLCDLSDFGCILVTVMHDQFKDLSSSELRKLCSGKPLFVDVRGAFNKTELEKEGFTYFSL